MTVGGVQYDVTTFTGTYSANTSKFALPPGGVMPWWGNSFLASQFALAVAGNLGFPNDATNVGPYFGNGATEDMGSLFVGYSAFSPSFGDGSGLMETATLDGVTSTWAQATPYTAPAPVPGPLPLLGAAAAFGFSRKLRKRIKLAPAALGSALPQA